MEPALAPTPSSREVVNLMAKGPTIPRNAKLGENKTSALTKAPARKPNGSVVSRMGRLDQGINSVNRAAKPIISESPVRFALSAQWPPAKYPKAKAIMVTEINEDQT